MTTEVKALTETEIQDRLYGGYRNRPRARRLSPSPAEAPALPPGPPAPARPAAGAGNERVWTGSEILSGELKRLRSELISLRREKEELAGRLQKIAQAKTEGRTSGSPSRGGWLGRVLAFLVIVAGGAVPMGARFLQASPAPGEPTPYTVQVAVYDVRPVADRAMEHLRGLGYPAFLAQVRRADGRPRYRVYVGSFVTKEEARQEHLRLAADPRFEEFKDAFVLVR